MANLPFIKMHGLSNDYVYIDCFEEDTAALIAHADIPALARRISDRHTYAHLQCRRLGGADVR